MKIQITDYDSHQYNIDKEYPVYINLSWDEKNIQYLACYAPNNYVLIKKTNNNISIEQLEDYPLYESLLEDLITADEFNNLFIEVMIKFHIDNIVIWNEAIQKCIDTINLKINYCEETLIEEADYIDDGDKIISPNYKKLEDLKLC